MKTILAAATLLGISLSVASGDDQGTPAEQYRDLLKAYNTAGGLFRAAKTDEQRKTAVERLGEFPGQFLDLADRNPTDPVALTAMRQAVQAVISVDSLAQQAAEMNRTAFPTGSQDGSAERIVALLLRDHLESDELGPICDRMRWGARREFERFLGAALEKSPHRNVRGMAALASAQLLHNHLRMIDLAKDRPELVTRYDDVFGEGYWQAIRGSGRSSLATRIETLYERAAAFDDVVNVPFTDSVAAKAKTELYDLRRLSIGKTAPDAKGHDQQGRPLALSDYRGKVVLLYFWAEF